MAIALLACADKAIAAPAQLLNKTVHFSYKFSAPAKGSDGSTITAARQVQRTIYISSKGRLFTRYERKEGGGTGAKDRGPDKTQFQFSGNQLVGFLMQASGATRVAINFDPEFRTCSLSLLSGAESGKPLQARGLNGVVYTALARPTFSGESCSVAEGNAFSS